MSAVPCTPEGNAITSERFDQYPLWRSRLRDILISRKDEESFLDELCFHGRCAISAPIPQMPPLHPSVTVDGVGRIGFPLCEEQANTLKSTFEPLVSDPCCWEIPSFNVNIQETPKWKDFLSNVTKKSLGRMGLQQDDVRRWSIKPVFQKLLLFEVGGFAKPWDCSASDTSMVGTLLIQLPSKFHGGDMTFLYDFPTIPLEQTIELNMSVGSDEQFFCSAFFSTYSQLELLPIVWGRRLCLMYRLVTTSSQCPDDRFLVDKWMVQNTREVCELPLRDIAESWDSECPLVAQACLLKGHYTQDTLAFENLNKEDLDTVQLLQDATDSHGNQVFSTSLLLMFKREFLFSSEENKFGTKLWVTPQGNRIESNVFSYEWLSKSVLQVTGKNDLDHAAFWADCHDKTERRYSGTTLSQYSGEAAVYYRSMVVFWPQSKDIEVTSTVSFPLALSTLANAKTLGKAELVLDLAERSNVFNEKPKEGWSHPAAKTVTVLDSFGGGASRLVARAIRLITKTCRLQNKEVIDSVFRTAGWMCSDEVDCDVTDLIKASVADCGRIDWSKIESKHPDGKDRKQLFINTYLLSSLNMANKVMENDDVAVRFLEQASMTKEIFPKAVDAVIKYAKPSLLSRIVESLLWQGTDCSAMTRLCTERLKQVSQDLDNGGPSFSWHQRRATFPHDEEHSNEVLHFLHGPEKKIYIYGFQDSKDARVWGQLHFGGNLKDRIRLYHFSVEFEAYELEDGRCVVMLTKTKEVSLKELKRKKKELNEEKTRLQKVLHIDQKTERPEKRQRHWFDQVVPDTNLW